MPAPEPNLSSWASPLGVPPLRGLSQLSQSLQWQHLQHPPSSRDVPSPAPTTSSSVGHPRGDSGGRDGCHAAAAPAGLCLHRSRHTSELSLFLGMMSEPRCPARSSCSEQGDGLGVGGTQRGHPQGSTAPCRLLCRMVPMGWHCILISFLFGSSLFSCSQIKGSSCLVQAAGQQGAWRSPLASRHERDAQTG